MFRALPVVALLLLTGCQREEASPPAPNATAAEETAPAAEVPSLEGEWRVAKVDGRDVGTGAIAALGGGKASIATGCLRRAWTYTQDRNMVDFAGAPGSANCGRTPSASEEAAYFALEHANMVIFSNDGRQADLSGTGGNLTLERS